MKNLIPFFALALLPAAMMISCGEEEVVCVAVCQNGGTCVADTCQCPDGFEGALCATELRALALGSRIGHNDQCTGGVSYTVDITANNSSGWHVNVSNLGNHGFTLVGTVSMSNPSTFYLSCPAQAVTYNGGQATVSANGAIFPQGTASAISYVILQNGVTTNCTVQL